MARALVQTAGVDLYKTSAVLSYTNSTPSTFADIPGASISFTVSGLYPVAIEFWPDGAGGEAQLVGGPGGSISQMIGYLKAFRDVTVLNTEYIRANVPGGVDYLATPASAFRFIELSPPAGTWTYKVQLGNDNGAGAGSITIGGVRMVVRELRTLKVAS